MQANMKDAWKYVGSDAYNAADEQSIFVSKGCTHVLAFAMVSLLCKQFSHQMRVFSICAHVGFKGGLALGAAQLPCSQLFRLLTNHTCVIHCCCDRRQSLCGLYRWILHMCFH